METTYESFISFCNNMYIEPVYEGNLTNNIKNVGASFKEKIIKFVKMVKDAIKKFVLWLSKTFGFDDVYISTDVQKYAGAINNNITQIEMSHSYSGHGEYKPFTQYEKDKINEMIKTAKYELTKEDTYAYSSHIAFNFNYSTDRGKFVKASKSDLQNQIKKIENHAKSLEAQAKCVDNDPNVRNYAADLMYAENKRLELMNMMMRYCIRKSKPDKKYMA